MTKRKARRAKGSREFVSSFFIWILPLFGQSNFRFTGTRMRSPSDYISKRALGVDASGIRKVFDLAARMKDPINLSIGLPDFDVPDVVKAAAIDAIKAGNNRYTQTQGIAPLRERLRKDLSAEMGRDVGEVLITSGVSGGLLLAMLAVVNPGDEVIFLDPYFVMYKHLLTMTGGKPVIVDSYPDFRFHADRVEKAITPRTKMLMLNSPSNPTGVLMTEAEVQAAVEVAKKHDLLILSDEIYEPFLYDVGTHGRASLPSAAKLYDKTIILRGFSKSHAMTGWRLGYAAGPEAVISQMTKLQQYTFVCAPSPLQYAALAAVDVPMRDAVTAYRRKRDIVFEGLSKKFNVVKPEGAFYIFPQAPRGMTASEFVAKAIENNVLVIPGNVFSERDTHFRISYATTDEKLRQGVEILNSLAS
jgi:aspartate aminotransferase/aminotransferase